MTQTYEVIGQPQIQQEYCTDEFQTVMVIDLKREDGETGDVWIIAGVPDHMQGSSQAARTQSGYQDVWVFGDSLDSWCPESFRAGAADDMRVILDVCRKSAIAAHKERYQAEYAEKF
jgi:hypothetical protein